MTELPPPSHPHRSHRAFTLVEIAVVVTLLGLLIAMALPAYRHVTIRSKAAAVSNDVRVFATAFQTYSTQHGSWPATAAAGVAPPEIADSLPSAFSRPSPIGGYYKWDYDSTNAGFHITASVSVVSSGASHLTDDVELLEAVDQTYDDGNTSTGNVQLSSTNDLVFIIEP
ncbi:MAG TPA: type II secretion system protein [Candidatus Didemnitutus sp.]|jgi:prepilin-type N-terminal cleavage/methylation domain-containing protein